MSSIRIWGLLAAAAVAGCASLGAPPPVSYDIRGEIHDGVYSSPEGSFSLQLPELWTPGARVQDEVRGEGTVHVTFADDLCREFALVRNPGDLGGQTLETWVHRNVDQELASVGAEIGESRTLPTRYGEGVYLRYRLPGGAPCEVLQIDDGEGRELRPDADVAMVVLYRDGVLYRFAYFLGISEGLGDHAFIQRGPVEELLETFLAGFRIVSEPGS